MTAQLERIRDLALDLGDDAADGAEVILTDAVARVPKESGDLATSGRVQQDRGTANGAGITFDGPYARWIHEHLGFHHPRGGEAKFLERAMTTKGDEAINRAGDHFWGRL